MKDKYEKLIESAGNKHRYQYTMLLITLMIWINIDIIPISLPFLEKPPDVEFIVNGEKIKSSLNYTICKWGKENIKDFKNVTNNKILSANYNSKLLDYAYFFQNMNSSFSNYGELNFTIIKVYPYSWVSEFGISCDPLFTGLLGSICFLGSLISSFIFQFQAHSLGRKKTAIVNLFLFCFLLLLFMISKDKYMILICLFLVQLTPGSVCLASFMNLSESLCHKKRSLFGAIINSGFCICGIFYILLFKYTENWRVVFLISSIMTFLSGSIYAFYSVESPRHYLSKGDLQMFIFSLEIIAYNNHKYKEFHFCITQTEIFNKMEKSFSCKNFNQKNEIEHKHIVKNIIAGEKRINYSFYQDSNSIDERKEFVKIESLPTDETFKIDECNSIIFENQDTLREYNRIENRKETNTKKSQILIFIIASFLWFSVSGNYYGLTIYLKSVPGDIYMNGILIYTFEIFSYFFSGYIINTLSFGRKGTLIIYFAISVFGYGLLMLNLNEKLIIILFLVTRFVVAGSFNILYTYSCEIYQTKNRAKGFAYNSAIGKIGSIIFPLAIELLSKYVNFLYMTVNFVCLLSMIWMPETLNMPMEDNFYNDENNN